MTVTSNLKVLPDQVVLENHHNVNIAFIDPRIGLNKNSLGFITCFVAPNRI